MSIAPEFLQRLAIAGIVSVLLITFVIYGKVPIRYNLRSLLVRWRTTVLTMLAFALVVGLLTVMLAFVASMYRVAAGSGRPANVIVLSDGATDEVYSGLDYQGTREIELHPAVARDQQGIPLASWEVYVVVNQPIEGAVDKRRRRFLQLRGVDDVQRAAAVHGLELHAGGAWFSGAGVQSPADASTGTPAVQAVIGDGIARELGKDRGKMRLEVGDLFEAGTRRWVVVGILNSSGSTFDSEVWAKRQVVAQTFGRERPTTLVLRTADSAAADELAHDLRVNYKKSPVNALVETEYYDKLNGTNQQFLNATILVTIILAVGGAFGTMNTMFAAVAQRSKDIAMLRILGFARAQILASFFLEVIFIAGAGGLIGCGLGALADGWTATSIISSGQGTGKSVVLKLSVDAGILLTGILFALGMGCVSGVAPAIAAMRLRPLDAMR